MAAAMDVTAGATAPGSISCLVEVLKFFKFSIIWFCFSAYYMLLCGSAGYMVLFSH
jgi:hypothetical protein